MMTWLTEHTLLPSDTWPLLLAALGAMCIGMSKAGLSGTSTLNVVLMAQIFGAKQSVGVILPVFNYVLNKRRQDFLALTEHRVFTWSMGFLAGVVTMLANAAGPVMTVYLLAQHLEKKEYLGVFSRFFLFINLFKVPFSTDLGIINGRSLMTNLTLMPCVVVGVVIGWWILKRLPQKVFENVLFWLTAFAAVWLIRG